MRSDSMFEELIGSESDTADAVASEAARPGEILRCARIRESGPPGSFPISTYSPLRKFPNSDPPETYDEHGAPPIATDAKMKKHHIRSSSQVEMSGKTTEWWLM